jgi:hypothetical protein
LKKKVTRWWRKGVQWWRKRVQAPQGDGMMFAVVIEKLNGYHHGVPLGLLLQSALG